MQNRLSHKEILILKAKEDLWAAKKLASGGDVSEEIILFHCQQSIEKSLKAYLDSNNINYPKSHDLEILLSLCVEKDLEFQKIAFVTELTSYAVESRYDEFVELPANEFSDILVQTEKAFDFILRKV